MHIASINDDRQQFSRIANGDEAAFRLIFDRYKEKLYYFIITIVKSGPEAEELVQDVFMRLWISRSSLTKVENPGTYIFVMARNRALDHIKKEKSDREMKARLSNKQYAINNVQEEIALKESRQTLHEAVNRLPEKQQKVYRLSREAGLSREEIAAQLNISPNTVKNHLADALASIRLFMKGKDEIILFILLTPIFGN